MGSMSLMHWLVVLAIVLVLFGAGKLPRVMGDFAKGIKAFKSGMKEEDEPVAGTPPGQVAAAPAAPGNSSSIVGPAATAAAGGATVTERPREHA
ncbi:MAG TPA: twin-arginine translocase TatA/TatE family subunit [Stellaceae bacterium]|nr:twin-arginine translocase TatA/TatE family subunit [Stellaceae bacterium]